MDRIIEDTFYIAFTTRAFATGIPATLSGSPVLSAYKDANLTQITAGITLSVDHDSVTGLNVATIVATGANGYVNERDYNLVITTGTVGGVSVVGEVVGTFSLSLSAAYRRLGAPAGASVSADIAVIEGQTDDIGVAGAGLTNINLPNQTMDIVGNITGNLSGSVGSVTAINTTGGAIDNVTLVATTATNTDMRGTDGANTTVPDAAGTAPTAVENRQEMDANSTQLAAIVLDTGTTLPTQIDSLGVKKNTAFSNYEFLVVLTSDHVTPATGLTVTGQRSIDGGAFASVSGSIAEVSNGIYQFDALAADTNGDVITWRFSSATADDVFETFKTI